MFSGIFWQRSSILFCFFGRVLLMQDSYRERGKFYNQIFDSLFLSFFCWHHMKEIVTLMPAKFACLFTYHLIR